jgi:uncharacterized protein with HEPN domain
MTGRRADASRIGDILRSIERLEEVLAEGYGPFVDSWRAQSAGIQELEVIGEASGAVSSETRKRHPGVRWEEMRRFSSFAKHEYWRVNPQLAWKALDEMPSLRERIARVTVRPE